MLSDFEDEDAGYCSDSDDEVGGVVIESSPSPRCDGVVRRVVRRSESGCGDVGGEHSARVPRDAGATFAQRAFFAGRFYVQQKCLLQ